MTDIPPRCPFCANVIKMQPSFWERMGLKAHKIVCPTCRKSSETQNAHMMGSAFWHWAELFRGQLTSALQPLPVLSEAAISRAMGNPHKDETQLIHSVEELVRQCLQHHRPTVVEKARGREATLEVAHLHNKESAAVEVLVILGTCSAESGSKESEQIVARHSHSHFVLYTYRAVMGRRRGSGRRCALATLHRPWAPTRMRSRICSTNTRGRSTTRTKHDFYLGAARGGVTRVPSS